MRAYARRSALTWLPAILAAVLLASGAAPARAGQVRVPQFRAAHAQVTARAAVPVPSAYQRHLWHLDHLRHLAHLEYLARLIADPPAAAPADRDGTAASADIVTQATSYSGSGSMQQCIIARESGGNPHAVNPYSGAGGLYQFLPSTWAALGFNGLPENAPVSEQNAAFYKEVAQDGGYSAWTPYDGC